MMTTHDGTTQHGPTIAALLRGAARDIHAAAHGDAQREAISRYDELRAISSGRFISGAKVLANCARIFAPSDVPSVANHQEEAMTDHPKTMPCPCCQGTNATDGIHEARFACACCDGSGAVAHQHLPRATDRTAVIIDYGDALIDDYDRRQIERKQRNLAEAIADYDAIRNDWEMTGAAWADATRMETDALTYGEYCSIRRALFSSPAQVAYTRSSTTDRLLTDIRRAVYALSSRVR